jgi:ribosomal subunit interface protein
VDIVVKGRHCEVPDRFRKHVAEKLSKLEKLDPKIIAVDVEVSKEHNPRLAEQSDRLEITCRSRGPAIRAEAAAADPYAALDIAWGRLESRLRRVADRRRVHHKGKSPVSVSSATASLSSSAAAAAMLPDSVGDAALGADTGPMVIREKVHEASAMTLDQALYEMELVGHDFYLFVDKDSGRPSVVYRRRGYDYGVIGLQLSE